MSVSTRTGFFQRAYGIVRQIPAGRVATYGQIAAMHSSPGVAGGVPCHRVVFKDGALAPGFAFGGPEAQRALLEDEGVGFLPDGRVDMHAFQWEA